MSRLRKVEPTSTTVATRSSSSRLRVMLRSALSWMRWRRNRTTQANPLAQLELMVRTAELQLELALLGVQQLQAEKERLALTLDVHLLERQVHPQLTPPEWTEPPPQDPTEPDPWTEPPPQEPPPTAFDQISQLIGLSPQQSSSLSSDS